MPYITQIPAHSLMRLSLVRYSDNVIESSFELTDTFILSRMTENSIRCTSFDRRNMFNYVFKYDNCLYLKMGSLTYLIHSITYNNRDLLNEFTICSQEELESQYVIIGGTFDDGTNVYLNANAVLEDNINHNGLYTPIQNSVSYPNTLSSEMIRTDWIPITSTGVTISSESSESRNTYIPTEEELKYPDVYVHNHNFNCRSSNPMVVGKWAENFNNMIVEKLKKMGFE